MATATFGKLDAIQEGEMVVYFTANDIAEDKKVPILLSIIGAKMYALLRTYKDTKEKE